jgi:hypothetical protein
VRRRRRAEGPGDCEVCGRVVLPGEPVHTFEDPRRGRRRHLVCALCQRHAAARGWVRPESNEISDHGSPVT